MATRAGKVPKRSEASDGSHKKTVHAGTDECSEKVYIYPSLSSELCPAPQTKTSRTAREVFVCVKRTSYLFLRRVAFRRFPPPFFLVLFLRRDDDPFFAFALRLRAGITSTPFHGEDCRVLILIDMTMVHTNAYHETRRNALHDKHECKTCCHHNTVCCIDLLSTVYNVSLFF